MSREDVINKWLVPSTDYKKKKGEVRMVELCKDEKVLDVTLQSLGLSRTKNKVEQEVLSYLITQS